MAGEAHGIGFGEAVRVWARIALLSFGGPAGQIAVMHRILVDEKKWIGEERFLHALNFCMLLPGPEAQQLATYIGWLLHKTKGGLVAGLLFILPGMIAIMALSWIYVLYGKVGAVAGLLFGLKAAVLALVFQAGARIGKRALGNRPRYAVAAAAFLALFLFGLPFPLIVLAAGAIGALAAYRGSQAFSMRGHDAAANGLDDAQSALGEELPAHAVPSARLALTAACLLLLWLTPVALLVASDAGSFAAIATFFSKLAVVTFGGAYAVLAYVGQAAVDTYGWLSPTEMLDGLGLAETTPGPLIMVTQFVGFLGAYRDPAGLSPLLAGTLGGLLTTWVTFVPCFLWIFVGAPYVERLRSNRPLSAALAGVSAAVVGVIFHLALWFAIHFLFARTLTPTNLAMELPDPASLQPAALLLSAAALLMALRFRLGIGWLLGGCALAGVLLHAAAPSLAL
jgi:chromate transporter